MPKANAKSDADKPRREYLTVAAVNPIDGKPYDVLISHSRIRAIGMRTEGQVLECAYVVPHVLQHPAAIFEGLMRDEDDDQRGCGWRCYSAIPPHTYNPDGTLRTPWPGKVFLVFINDERVAYNWR